MAQEKDSLALLGSGSTTNQIDNEALERLFEAFIACRTTLDDLSSRTATMGEDLSGPIIAAHLTGTSCMSAQGHNVVAAAINARLAELSLPATAPYTDQFPET
jgi:isopentenyl diphosphate isomerase/L-lactate dehydrogenase-like FMN-dependent dehydrogenase